MKKVYRRVFQESNTREKERKWFSDDSFESKGTEKSLGARPYGNSAPKQQKRVERLSLRQNTLWRFTSWSFVNVFSLTKFFGRLEPKKESTARGKSFFQKQQQIWETLPAEVACEVVCKDTADVFSPPFQVFQKSSLCFEGRNCCVQLPLFVMNLRSLVK